MKNHGGKRLGAGRKATGRISKTKSISMPIKSWEKLEAVRGQKSRGLFIAILLDDFTQRP